MKISIGKVATSILLGTLATVDYAPKEVIEQFTEETGVTAGGAAIASNRRR